MELLIDAALACTLAETARLTTEIPKVNDQRGKFRFFYDTVY